MVLKSLNLARQSLAKTFTQGYAQSLVAATQSSYASQNHPFTGPHSSFASRFGGKVGAQTYSAFQPKEPHASKNAQDVANADLSAYLKAWQKGQRLGEWNQYAFQKRLEWDAPAAVKDAAASEDVKGTKATRATVTRAYSSNAVDDIKAALELDDVQVPASTSREVSDTKAVTAIESHYAGEAVVAVTSSADINPSAEDSLVPPTPKSAATVESPQLSDLTRATSVSVPESYAEELNKLAEQQQYGEIPALFEHMLAQGVQPTASAYNALLVSALCLTQGRHQIVPKALDVYADMLRRCVAPDSTTYSILIELLCARALDVRASQEHLEEKRVRFGGMEEQGRFMFGSNQAEFDILAEDDSLALAIKLFNAAAGLSISQAFTETTYSALVNAVAGAGKVDEMVNVFSHMERHGVTPRADMFVPMIQAFGASGDLRSAVECYDEYKALVIADSNGELGFVRKDDEVYAALVKAYQSCDRSAGANKFIDKVESTYSDPTQLVQLRDVIGMNAVIPHMINKGDLDGAYDFAFDKISPSKRDHAISAICTAAADADRVDLAVKAYTSLSDAADITLPALALGAMHIRAGNLVAAEAFWKVIQESPIHPQLLEATAMHTVALMGSGHAETALQQCRDVLARLRTHTRSQDARAEAVEQIDEAIEFIGAFVRKRGLLLSVQANMELMWMMIDNGGLVTPVAGQLLATIGPDQVAQLSLENLNLLIQVQAGMLLNAPYMDIAHEARFVHLFEVVLANGMDVNKDTARLIDKVLSKLGRADLSQRWLQHCYPVAQPVYAPTPRTNFTSNSPIAPNFEDNYDPYAATTDNKGSVAITDLLDRPHGKSASHLTEALSRFKNIRRAGRHPRFFTYAKLISAAAKEDRFQVAQDILNLAKQDVPFSPQYRIVRFGWVSILDAMVAACLTTGNRKLAAQYHQDLFAMGAAPSANTFGLYITTLKESTKTFDEATEAVKIFIRSKAEGVEPSSFLYNALIGKLGKARRIDDCLFYFAEMRNLGIRPTSVTYGTIVNALCRVSDEKFAEELFEEMESMPNYKPRPAPYHSMMQFFLSTKRDRSKVLAYYERMKAKNIQPTTHTYKLLIDTHATLEPVNMEAAEAVLGQIRRAGTQPEAVHFASLIHAKGCVLHDIEGARKIFDEVSADSRVRPQACIYQALFEAMVANHLIEETGPILSDMQKRRVEMTPYIANSLIHGWAMAKDISKAEAIYKSVPMDKREPSTYEAMTRAYMAVEDRENATNIVNEGLSRGYPAAVANKILELVGGGRSDTTTD